MPEEDTITIKGVKYPYELKGGMNSQSETGAVSLELLIRGIDAETLMGDNLVEV